MDYETIPAGEKLDELVAEILRELCGSPKKGDPIPAYSTDIGAAWKIVEAVREAGGEALIDVTDDETCEDDDAETPYSVTFFIEDEEDDDAIEVGCDSAPLAICRAFIAALSRE